SKKRPADYEGGLGLKNLTLKVGKDGREQRVLESPDGKQIVAFGRLNGPNWYLLLSYPKTQVAASAARSASWVLLIGGLASAIQALLVVMLARGSIVRPIERLAASC